MTINFETLIALAGNEGGARELFEDVIAQLIRIQHPTVKQVMPSGGDWGVDAYVGDLDAAVQVWQSKFFVHGVHVAQQAQIRKSFSTVVAASKKNGFRLINWTLCLPDNLTMPVHRWWSRWSAKQQHKYGVTITLWDLSTLQSLLMRAEARNIREMYFALSGTSALDRQSGIPVDFMGSIRDFVHEYSKNSFLGRKDIVKDLDDWIDATEVSPYRLILGPAGRGKSALLVHWSLEVAKRDDVDTIFLPISSRFRTNTATAILLSLTSRLALLHDRSVPNLLGMQADVLRDLARRYLQSIQPSGKIILVIFDGLDEALDKEILRGLLPTEPPATLRVVLAARPYLGEAKEGVDDDWLSLLGMDFPAGQRPIAVTWLAPLSETEVQSVASDYLPVLSATGETNEAASALFRVSNGEPFILMLYLQRLRDKESISQDILAEMKKLDTGLDAYFRYWWHHQELIWGNSNKSMAEAVLSTLQALSVALGPAEIEDIQSICGGNFSYYAIKESLRELFRFVVTTGEPKKFDLVHERFREFVRRELMSPREIDALEARIVQWGLSELKLAKAQVNHQVPEYLVRYFGAHIRQRTPDLALLPLLLGRIWANAWYRLEGNYSGFLGEVSQVGSDCMTIYVSFDEPSLRAKAFVESVHSLLVQGSVVSASQSLPAKLVQLLRAEGVWTDLQALSYIGTIHDSKKKSNALAEFGRVMIVDSKTIERFLDLSLSLWGDEDISRALCAIAPRTPRRLLQKLLDVVVRIRTPGHLAAVITSIAERADENEFSLHADEISAMRRILQRAYEDARENYQKCSLLLALARIVEPSESKSILRKAAGLARSIADNEGQFQGMAPLLKGFSLCSAGKALYEDEPALSESLFAEAFQVVSSAAIDDFSTHAFRVCADCFGGDIFDDALKYARDLDQKSHGVGEALMALLGGIDVIRYPRRQELVERFILEKLESMASEKGYQVYYDWLKLERYLVGEVLRSYEVNVQAMEEAEWRLKCILTLIGRLDVGVQARFAEAVVKECWILPHSSWKFEVLADAGAYLSKVQKEDLAGDMLRQAQIIGDNYYKYDNVVEMASFVDNVRPDVFNDAESEVIVDSLVKGSSSDASRTVIRKLGGKHRRELLGRLGDASGGGRRVAGLFTLLAPHVGDGFSLEEYLEAVSRIRDAGQRIISEFALVGSTGGSDFGSSELRARFVAACNDNGVAFLIDVSKLMSPSRAAFVVDCLDDISNLYAKMELGSWVLSFLEERGKRDEFLGNARTALYEIGGSSGFDWVRRIVQGLSGVEQRSFLSGYVDVSPVSPHAKLLLLCEILPVLKDDNFRQWCLELFIDCLEGAVGEPTSSVERWGTYRVWENVTSLVEKLRQGGFLPDWAAERLVDFVLSGGYQGREMLKCLVPSMTEQKLAEYVEMAKNAYSPSDRIEFLEKAVSRLSEAQVGEIMDFAIDTASNYYISNKAALSLLRLAASAVGVDLLKVVRLSLDALSDSSKRLVEVKAVREFFQIIECLEKIGRLAESERRELQKGILGRLGVNERSNVLSLLSGMAESINATVGSGTLASIIQLIAETTREWP